MKNKLSFLLVSLSGLAFLGGCATPTPITEPIPQPSKTVLLPAPQETTLTSTVTPTLVSTPTPYSTPVGINLPMSVYIFSPDHQSVWRLDPGDSEAVQISPPDLRITSFHIWSGDGRIAYGTEDGQLYTVMPGQEPRLIYDARDLTDLPLWINSVAWSPDGTRLAYGVHLSSEGFISDETIDQLAGIWLITMEDGSQIQLMRNKYLAEDDDINLLRVFSNPFWSPDGTGLLLTAYYWEWVDTHMLDSVAPDPGQANLYDLPGDLWTTGSWSNDGQSILLSGTGYARYSDLIQVDRRTMEAETLIVGELEGLFISNAHEINTGVAFLASIDFQGARLYLGHQTEQGFRYEPAGPEPPLCKNPIEITWDPTGKFAALSCHEEVYIITLDGTMEINLAPYLGSLAGEPYLKVLWGPSTR